MKKFLKWALGLVIAAAVALGVIWFVDRDLITNLFNEETVEVVEDVTTEVVEVVDTLATEVVDTIENVNE